MFPTDSTAASLVPSLEEVMPCQFCALPLGFQLAPESAEIQMFPPHSTAASLVPSLEDVMPSQFCALPLGFQLAPESAEIQMFPPYSTAASLAPSLEDVMPSQFFELPSQDLSIQLAFTGASTDSESRATSRTLSRHRRGIVSI
jgi:hypothetical protein